MKKPDAAKLPFLLVERLPYGGLRYRVGTQVAGKRVRITIQGEFGSKEFLDAYAKAVRSLETGSYEDPKPPKLAKGSVGWLVGEFLDSMELRERAKLLSPATMRRYRLFLGRLLDAQGPNGEPMAVMSAAMPRRELIRVRDTLLATPSAADSFLKTVSAMYQWARREGVLDIDNPAKDVKRVDTKSDGYLIATTEDVRAFMRHHREGTLARLTMVLLLSTAARRGDLVRLGPKNIVTIDGSYWLRWKQEKPPHLVVEIPLLDALKEELDRHEPRGDTFLATAYGKQRSKAAFGNLFSQWADEAGTKPRLHGYRKGLASILPEFGLSNYHIDVLLGHELGSEASNIYTRGARRREIAKELNATWGKITWEKD